MKLIKDLGMEYPTEKSNRKYRYGIFKCESCGNSKRTTFADAKRGKGLCRRCSAKTHGQRNTRLYRIHAGIKQRCLNVDAEAYKNYGARGILLFEEWNDFPSFRDWAMKNGYTDELSIDREDNDGNYEPSNCRWTTTSIQADNTREIISSNKSGHRGVSKKKDSNKWVAQISIEGKKIHIGYFDTKEEAIKAYGKKRVEAIAIRNEHAKR